MNLDFADGRMTRIKRSGRYVNPTVCRYVWRNDMIECYRHRRHCFASTNDQHTIEVSAFNRQITKVQELIVKQNRLCNQAVATYRIDTAGPNRFCILHKASLAKFATQDWINHEKVVWVQ